MSALDRKPTLVMGARGAIGAHVLNELLARKVPVRASTRSPQPEQFPAQVDARVADLTEPATLAAAFEGVGSVFLYANIAAVDGVIGSARTAGVERIVLLSSGSVLNPTARGNAITEEHREVEDAFAASGLTVLPIRPLVLAANALGWSDAIAASSQISLYRPDAITAPIHERDVAAVAVAALEGAEGTSAMLTGPAPLSQRQQVAAIAAARGGGDIRVSELSREEAFTQFRRFMRQSEAEAVLQFLEDADAGNSPATDAVERILGRPAIGFDAWAIEHASDFAGAR